MSTNICPASPPGYFYRSDCRLLCRPAAWSDVVVFFLGNYVAHIPTVVSQPGQSLVGNILFPALALLFPGTGYAKALSAIWSRAVFARTELQMAARAGALCIVAPIEVLKQRRSRRRRGSAQGSRDGDGRDGLEAGSSRGDVMLRMLGRLRISTNRRLGDDEQAQSADHREHNTDEDEESLEVPDVIPRLLSPIVHGVYRLPKGYCFIRLDKRARFVNDPEDDPVPTGKRILSCFMAAFRPRQTERVAIACDHNVVKILVTTLQLVYALVTLYRTRGDQIAMYGYAAFGLTVAQYAWMSLLNLVGSVVRPNYQSVFVVESQTLKDLRSKIDAAGETDLYPLSGTVGELTGETEKEILENFDGALGEMFAAGGTVYLGAVPVAIIGGMSRFTPGGSALYQRVWTMMWLVFGFLMGPSISIVVGNLLEDVAVSWPRPHIYLWIVRLALTLGAYATPAIGGFVVVGQMIFDYGVCIRLREVSV